jgi:tetratricopeptide (TPR) repeat protein
VFGAIRHPEDAAQPTGQVLHCQCSPHHGSVAFWPIARQLASLAGVHEGEAPEPALDKVEALLAPLAGGKPMAPANALIADLLGLDGRSRYGPLNLTPEAQRSKTMTVLCDWLVRRADEQPQLILIEDVHWVDPTSWELLELLFATIERARILVLMTSRPEDRPPIGQLGYLTSLTLNRLDLGTMRAIAERIAGDRLDAETAAAIVERADGVPLFVEELTKTMLITGQTRVPDSLYAALMARLDRDPTAKGIAQIAACIGRQFDLDLLTSIAERAAGDIDASIRKLVDAGVVARAVARDKQIFTFKHALLRDVAYQNLLRKQRHQIHERIFRVLGAGFAAAPLAPERRAGVAELALLATHAAGAQLHAEASRYWEQAGRLAANEFAHAEAVSHLEKAIGSLRSLAEAGAPRAQTRSLLLELVASLRILGRYQQALDALAQAEQLTGRHEPLELAKIYYMRGNIFFPMGRADDCRAAHETALAHAIAADSAECEARVSGGLADAAYVDGRMLTAFANFSRCIDLAREHGFAAIEIANLPMRGWGHYYRCDPAAALRDGLASVAGAVRQHKVREEMLAHAASQYFAWELGDSALSRRQCKRASELAKRLGAGNFEPFNLLNLALLTAAQDRGKAVEIAAAAVERARATGPAFTGPWALGALAVVAEDADTRRRAVAEGLELLNKGALAHCHFWFYRHAIDASIAAGDWAEVEPLAARLEAFAAAEPLPWITFLVERARALSAVARAPSDQGTRNELRRLRATAGRHRLVVARRAIDAALAIPLCRPATRRAAAR